MTHCILILTGGPNQAVDDTAVQLFTARIILFQEVQFLVNMTWTSLGPACDAAQ